MPDRKEKEFGALVDALQAGNPHQDLLDRAATELLIWHEHWLRHAGFCRECIETPARGAAWINWAKARVFADAEPLATTSQAAILDLAITIGENRFRLTSMGHAHKKAIVRAFEQALGLEVPGA